MTRERAVIHLNIADFAARVEARMTPALTGRPLVIAPEGAPRARVFDMSEAAFQEGIRKGMPLARARRLSPRIPVLPPKFRHYHLAMKDIFRQARAFTPVIESGRADGHLFLDITGTSRLYGPPKDVAFRLKKEILRDLGLNPVWTLATNKLVAKAASRVVKPTGEYIVKPGEEEAFLAPLPVHLIPGLTPGEIKIMARFNLDRVSQVKRLTPAQLAVPFDHRASHIHGLLRGIDDTPVGGTGSPAMPAGRFRAGHEFAQDTNDAGHLKAGLALALARLCRTLRKEKRQARDLTLVLVYSDGIQIRKTRQVCGDTEGTLLPETWDLLESARARRTRIQSLYLTCTHGPLQPRQAVLFAPPAAKGPSRALTRAMDRVKERFGPLAVRSGATLCRTPTWS